MADNTLQFRWITTIQGGLDTLFAPEPNVFVAGDLLWYPVQGEPNTRQAPDILVAFGRPKGERGFYRQWEEGGIAPQVVFEILSPGNRFGEMQRKFGFYERHGVDEYYVYDPDEGELFGWLRCGDRLQEVERMEGWVSPHLKVTFGLDGKDLKLVGPDGRRFVSYADLASQRAQAEKALETLRTQLKALGAEPKA